MECRQRHQLNWPSVRSLRFAQVIRALLVRFFLILLFLIVLGSLQACGGGGGHAPAASNIQSITIDPPSPTVAAGTSLQLRATVNYKNKTTKDVTTSATWASVDPRIANVSNATSSEGLTSGASVGNAKIQAKFGGQTGSAIETVTNATLKSITVTPDNSLIAKGTTVQLAAQGNFSDGSVEDLTNQVTWSAANSAIAPVSNTAGTMGLVTGLSVGKTPETATLNGVSGSTKVTVSAATLTSITITATAPVDSIAKGTTFQLTATCTFSDGGPTPSKYPTDRLGSAGKGRQA
jgi:hypothetical protein